MTVMQSRRRFLNVLATTLPLAAATRPATGRAGAAEVDTTFPTQPPELVQEMVVVSHGNLAKVKALIDRRPTLAKAAWDWGFGDWETALGAASHVGHREIAQTLLASGAHPTIFSAAMLGDLDVVKAFIAASPGVQRTRGPHSIPLLSHAVAGGPAAAAVVAYLKTIEGADDRLTARPLTDAEIATLTGTYSFGVTPADRIDVTTVNAQLQFARPGHYGRGLIHLGSYEFCPVGAENVRVRFSESAESMTMTVHDPDVVLSATKVAR